MAYKVGDSKQIIVGAAAMFISNTGPFASAYASSGAGALPNFVPGTSYKTTLSAWTTVDNVGYTNNGLDLQFQPNFGTVNVDQILDVAKLYKQGMQVNLNTSFAEATLKNLLIAVAGRDSDLTTGSTAAGPMGGTGSTTATALDLKSGELGSCPIERGIVAVGPGTGDCAATNATNVERIYVGYRALSIQNVNATAKRDAATVFDVSFRLLPDDTSGSYGKIVDRTIGGS